MRMKRCGFFKIKYVVEKIFLQNMQQIPSYRIFSESERVLLLLSVLLLCTKPTECELESVFFLKDEKNGNSPKSFETRYTMLRNAFIGLEKNVHIKNMKIIIAKM